MKFTFFWAAKHRNKSLHFLEPLSQPGPKLPAGPVLPEEFQDLLLPAFLGILQAPVFPQLPPDLGRDPNK